MIMMTVIDTVGVTETTEGVVETVIIEGVVEIGGMSIQNKKQWNKSDPRKKWIMRDLRLYGGAEVPT